ncbi:MAG: acyl carrier protein [Candidatus Hodarchaeota archaeon]
MDIKEKLRQFIMEELSLDGPIKDLKDDDLLIESGLIDSMGILNLLAFLEQNYGILLSEDELNVKKFATLQSICDTVDQKLAET